MGGLLSTKFISKDGVHELKRYKYKAAGSSFMTDALTPFWNTTAEYLPLWLAPNVVSLLGAVAIFFSFTVCALYSPVMDDTSNPWWVHVTSGICLFLYQLFDNLDGKQARRTKSSSPLGELFDHGLDAIVMGLSIPPFATALGCDPLFGLAFMLSTQIAFYTCHWEAYHTSVTYFSMVNSVVEAQLLGIMCMTVAALFSSGFFHVGLNGIKFYHVIIVFSSTMALLGSLQNFYTVTKSALAPEDTATAEDKNNNKKKQKPNPIDNIKNMVVMYTRLTPLFLFVVTTIVWAYHCPFVLINHTYLSYYVISLTFGYIMQRLLVQHLAKEPTRHAYGIQLVYALVAAHACVVSYYNSHNIITNNNTNWWASESFHYNVMCVAAVLCTAQELVFGYCIIKQMTGFLKIKAFSIPIVEPNKHFN